MLPESMLCRARETAAYKNTEYSHPREGKDEYVYLRVMELTMVAMTVTTTVVSVGFWYTHIAVVSGRGRGFLMLTTI